MNDNWIKTSMVKPKEGATCLVTTQGDIALAKYSEGYFTQYGNDDVSYNNVTAWQYPCSPFPLEEFDKNRFEMDLEHFRLNIQHEEIYEGYRSYNLFGCQADDTLYIAKPTTQVDIKAINELYLYKNYGSICDTDLKPPLTKEDIGSLIVVLCELGDFRNCEFIRIERYDETIQEITEEINNYRNRFI